MFEKKYKILLIRKHHNAYFLIKVVQQNDLKPIVKFNDKEFTVSIENPCYITSKQRIYLLDYDNGSQFTLNEAKALMNPTDLDLIVGQKIIKELTAGVIDNRKEKMINMLLGFVMGALIAAMVAILYYTNQIQELIEEYASNQNTIVIQ